MRRTDNELIGLVPSKQLGKVRPEINQFDIKVMKPEPGRKVSETIRTFCAGHGFFRLKNRSLMQVRKKN
jgi:hypothetical protein